MKSPAEVALVRATVAESRMKACCVPDIERGQQGLVLGGSATEGRAGVANAVSDLVAIQSL